ncbi:LOW QUALITY PROTEIN: hypothetical protein QYF61_006581 [Mycteria americana]|uniref:Uncharacterized protein n=1 Tax=Mycteria americana TaxID=33587 RepID=A0AAN7NQK5_MYCAM|nr:LOW QUALITY PROTEIN: hypothetical protein QYF61_006581 [Mycteria americana]
MTEPKGQPWDRTQLLQPRVHLPSQHLALAVRKTGLAFATMNWGFGCASKPSAYLLLLALRSHRSHQYLPNKTFAHESPNLEEEHAQTLTPMQTRGYTAFCQEAHRASGALHIFWPSHAYENACGRQRSGSGSGGPRNTSDLQAPGDGGAPGGPQPQLPPGGQLSSLPPPCPGSEAQEEIPPIQQAPTLLRSGDGINGRGPVPMVDNPFSEEIVPNIQSKPPLVQLEAISSCPMACYLGEETDPHLTTTSFQVVVKSDKVSPQPPFLQAKQPQFSQPLLIRLVLQTLHQLHCPSLDTLQHLNVSLVVRGPKLNTVFEVRPHQCRVQGHNHFPSPAGCTIPDTSQDTIGLLGHLGTLPAHIHMAIDQHPQVLFHRAAFQPLCPKPVALHGVVVTQVQDLALGLVEPYTIDLGPSTHPVQIALLPTLQQINTPTQLGVICKLTESALGPLIQVVDKDIKQNWPQHRALRNTTCDRPPTGVNSIHHHSLGPAIQPVFYPAKHTHVQAMSSQFLQENAVGNRVKGFTKV